MKWSAYQNNIFEDVASGKGSTVVEALAGSAKTTTLVQSLRYLPKGSSWLLVAFNKRIADELKSRAPAGGEIQTLHALGLKAISRTYPNIVVEPNKADTIVSKILEKIPHDKADKYNLLKTISLAKACLISSHQEIDNIIDLYDSGPLEMDRDKFINHVSFAMDICKRKNLVVDFDDMVWFPNVLPVKLPQFDYIFVDEAQDLNKTQIEFILKLSNKKNRTFAFLDRNQAIYFWRGADANGVDRIKTALQAKSLPLSITYRCPKVVVTEAQKYVPALEAAPNAIEGKIEEITYGKMLDTVKPGCFILSRTNAPLMRAAMILVKKRIPCNIQGRDIGENLLALVKKSRAKTIEKLIIYIEKLKTKEINRLLEKGLDENSLVIDKTDCLLALAKEAVSITSVKDTITELFSDKDDSNRVILSSTHKAKGLERDIVYVLWYTYGDSPQEEINLKYVAVTRAKKELYLVLPSKKEKAPKKQDI